MSAITRRRFFTELGMGFPALVLAAMLHRDGFARADETSAAGWKPPDGRPHFTPRAKNVIWLFMIGGTSHLESFDPKPRSIATRERRSPRPRLPTRSRTS